MRKVDLAYRAATTEYALEQDKRMMGQKGLSSEKIAESVGNRFGVSIAHSTLRRKVNKQGQANVGKYRTGPVCRFGQKVYNALTGAFITMITLNQSGSNAELTQSQLSNSLSHLFDGDNDLDGDNESNSRRTSRKIAKGAALYKRLRNSTAAWTYVEK